MSYANSGYRDPNTDLHVRPVDEWFVEDTAGNMHFANPFGDNTVLEARLSGETPQAERLNPNEMPAIFAGHFGLRDAIDYAPHLAAELPYLELGVLLTNATVESDILDKSEFRDMVAGSDPVVVGFNRGVKAETELREFWPADVPFQQSYRDYIFSVAADLRKPMTSIDIATDIEGRTMGATDGLMVQMHNKAHDAIKRYGIEDGRSRAVDLAYRNMEQSRLAAAFVLEAYKAANQDTIGSFELGVLPAEMGMDVPRRIVNLGFPVERVGAAYANECLATEELETDAEILNQGYIPAEDL
jgi:hypothetical protein